MKTQKIVEQALEKKELEKLRKDVYEYDQDIYDSALTLENGTLTVVYCQPLLDFLPKVLDHVAKYLGLKKLVIQDTVRSFEDIPESCFEIPIEFQFCYELMSIKNFSRFRAEKMCLVDFGGWVEGKLSDGEENGPNEHVTELHLKFHQKRDEQGILDIINDFPNLQKVRLSSMKREDEEQKDMSDNLLDRIGYISDIQELRFRSGLKYETLYSSKA